MLKTAELKWKSGWQLKSHKWNTYSDWRNIVWTPEMILQSTFSPIEVDKNKWTLTAITLLHFAFITKYVAHFVAQSLLFPAVAITRLWKNYPSGPFPQVLSQLLLLLLLLLWINRKNWRFFTGARNWLPLRIKGQKSDGRLQIWCSIQLSLHKEPPEVRLVKNLTGPYIESTTVLSDY